MASSRLARLRTENFSAARIVLALKNDNDLPYQIYDTHTNQKSYPRGVQFYLDWAKSALCSRRSLIFYYNYKKQYSSRGSQRHG